MVEKKAAPARGERGRGSVGKRPAGSQGTTTKSPGGCGEREEGEAGGENEHEVESGKRGVPNSTELFRRRGSDAQSRLGGDRQG